MATKLQDTVPDERPLSTSFALTPRALEGFNLLAKRYSTSRTHILELLGRNAYKLRLVDIVEPDPADKSTLQPTPDSTL